MAEVDNSVPKANNGEGKEPSTAQEFSQKIQEMTIEFNRQMEEITNVRNKFTTLQSKSLSDALKLSKVSSEKRKTEIEEVLNDSLSAMSDLKDELITKQGSLISHAISLMRTKDIFTNHINNARLSAEETAQKLKEQNQKPEAPKVEEVTHEAKDAKRSKLLNKLLEEAKAKGVDVTDLE